jgi:hypothetical protein
MGKMAPGLGPLASDFRGGFLVATKAEEPVGSGWWDGRTDWPTRVQSSTSVLRGAQQGAMGQGQPPAGMGLAGRSRASVLQESAVPYGQKTGSKNGANEQY